MSDWTIAIRLLIAAALGGVIGFERELKDQPAGLRTHMLVSVGASLFALVSAFGFDAFTSASSTQAVRADVTRISSQIVVGIGFLGGGTILRHGSTVRGLTTAASLWVTAAVGLAVAMGFYAGAIAATVLVLLTLGLKPITRLIRRKSGAANPPEPLEPG